MSLQSYYRTFLRTPYSNANYLSGQGKRKRKSKQMRGGRITRFGGPLSGNANPRVFRGSPHGGAEGKLVPKFRDLYQIGSGRRRKYYGSGLLMDDYINPMTTYHTYPHIGTTIY